MSPLCHLTSPNISFGHLPPVGLRYLCLTAWGRIPPVVSPTLGESSLCIPPVAPAELPALFHPRIWDIYLRCSETFTSRGAEQFSLTARRCIPPVVSPTLGGSTLSIPPVAFAELPAQFRPRLGTSTCGATKTITSGGAEIFMPDGMGMFTCGAVRENALTQRGMYTSGGKIL